MATGQPPASVAEAQMKLISQMEEMVVDRIVTLNPPGNRDNRNPPEDHSYQRQRRTTHNGATGRGQSFQMRTTCTRKCTNKQFDQPDVMKPEAVCIDRCVAKYMEFHDVIGKRLASDKDTYAMLSTSPVEKKSDDTKTETSNAS